MHIIFRQNQGPNIFHATLFYVKRCLEGHSMIEFYAKVFNGKIWNKVFPCRNNFGFTQLTQLIITCSKSPIETLEKGRKYVQS